MGIEWTDNFGFKYSLNDTIYYNNTSASTWLRPNTGTTTACTDYQLRYDVKRDFLTYVLNAQIASSEDQDKLCYVVAEDPLKMME